MYTTFAAALSEAAKWCGTRDRPINEQTDKQNELHACNEISFSHKKKRSTDMRYNVVNLETHYAK